ncbi:MAG TPA: TIGR03435 family protein [Bryobacteraceae bacterium]
MKKELLALGAVGPTSRLGNRIEALLVRGCVSSSAPSIVRVVASGTLLLAFAIASSFAPGWIVFAQRLEFDAASIRANHSRRVGFDGLKISHGSFRTVNVTPETLMEGAYRLPKARIAGGPAWFSSDRFDITAKGNDNSADSQVRLMLQSLLADRFGLVVHRETRTVPIYELVLAKSGSKLRKVKDGACTSQPSADRGVIDLMQAIPCGEAATAKGPQGQVVWGRSVSASVLADMLSDLTERPVIDRTGLGGQFEVQLLWSPEGYKFIPPNADERARADSTDAEAPGSVFAAVQEQLGLKLQPAKGPVEVLVIDHLEKPSEN